nr:hypothetical protein [Tanacetum cinerariifolium]
ARIETTKEGTKILATIDGILRTVTESSLRINLKLQDEEGITLLPVADEPASLLRDVSQVVACPTDSGFRADYDRANIAKTSTLPHDSAPRVTSPTADEGYNTPCFWVIDIVNKVTIYLLYFTRLL